MSSLPPEEMRARIIPTTAEIQSLRAALTASEARCEQAIDALREIEHWPYSVTGDAESDVQAMKQRARAALLSLGEQP